jgi:hypothetical protein
VTGIAPAASSFRTIRPVLIRVMFSVSALGARIA